MSRRKIIIPVIVFTVVIIFLIIAFNPNYKYNKLIVSESKWNDIKESRLENKNLVLKDIKFNDYKLIIDEKNNMLYYSLVNDSQNKYNPKVEYATNGKNAKMVILSDEITDEKIDSNHQFEMMIYDEREYHVYNLKCTKIPILNISFNKNQYIKEKNIPMEMYLFDNLSNIPNKITISSGKLKLNDDSYIFSLHMLTPGKNRRDNKLSILNMKPNSEYILTKLDESQMDNKNVDNKKQIVELFLNNEYIGVYSLGNTEKRVKK